MSEQLDAPFGKQCDMIYLKPCDLLDCVRTLHHLSVLGCTQRSRDMPHTDPLLYNPCRGAKKHTHMHALTNTHTHKLLCTHTHTFICKHKCSHSYLHTHTDTHRHKHTHVHTSLRAHTHTCQYTNTQLASSPPFMPSV